MPAHHCLPARRPRLQKRGSAAGAGDPAAGATLAVGQSTPQPAQPAAGPARPRRQPRAHPPFCSCGGTPGRSTRLQRKEIERPSSRMVLINNPEVLSRRRTRQAKMDKIQADRGWPWLSRARRAACSAGSPVAGNVKGDVPVIEFFDYNCGYCKKAFVDLATLIDKDKKVRDPQGAANPVQGLGGGLAHRPRRQNAGQILGVPPGNAGKPGAGQRGLALRVAESWPRHGRLKKDMASAEVKKEIDDTRQLATKMGIQGTPHFIVGDRIILGAPENLAELLGKHVSDVRKDGCKVC